MIRLGISSLVVDGRDTCRPQGDENGLILGKALPCDQLPMSEALCLFPPEILTRCFGGKGEALTNQCKITMESTDDSEWEKLAAKRATSFPLDLFALSLIIVGGLYYALRITGIIPNSF